MGQGAWKLLEKQVWRMGSPLGPGGTAGSRRSGRSTCLSVRLRGSSQTPEQRWQWGSGPQGGGLRPWQGCPQGRSSRNVKHSPRHGSLWGEADASVAGAFRDLESSGPCSPGGLPARGDLLGALEAGLRMPGREECHGPSSQPRPDTYCCWHQGPWHGTEPVCLSITTGPPPLPNGESRLSPEPRSQPHP